MAEHRVPMLGAALRRATLRGKVDPQLSADPQVRELVAALSTLDVTPAPRADFRAELRAQLVAVAPRLVAEGDPTLTTADERAEQKRKARSPEGADAKRGFRYARPLIAAACVLTAFVVLLGGAVWMSKKALPGDTLYGLKRASEDTRYGLTGSTIAKAKLKLEFAENRIDESADLLHGVTALGPGVGSVADGGISNTTVSLVRDTLSSADGDVTDAAAMLEQAARRNHSAAPLQVFTDWAPRQVDIVTDNVLGHIPASNSGLQADARHTIDVVRARSARLHALEKSVTAPAGPATPTPSTSAPKSGSPAPHSVPGAPRVTVVPPAGTRTAPGGSRPTTTPPAGGTSGSTTPGAPATSPPRSSPSIKIPTTLPGLHLPSGILSSPTGTPTLPITVDTCGVKASLPGINISLGPC